MARTKPRVGLMRTLARITLAVLALGLAVPVAWLLFTQQARVAREVRSVEDLAAERASAGQSGRWVAVGDADLFVQEWGRAGDPVVLLTHGTGAWGGTWFELPLALARAGWRVVAVDLPPFGLSRTSGTAPRVDYSRSAQSRRLLGLIAQLGGAVTLVGHSFGAGPALEAALHAGPGLRQLVLVDPALGLGSQGEAPQCDRAAPGLVDELLSLRELRTQLVGASATWPGLTATLLRSFVHRKDVVSDTLVPAYQLPMQRVDYSARLGDWAVAFAHAACEDAASLDPQRLAAWARNGTPVGLVWGEADTITPIAQARALQAWLPQATLARLPEVGHIPHIESPTTFAAALLVVLGAPR